MDAKVTRHLNLLADGPDTFKRHGRKFKGYKQVDQGPISYWKVCADCEKSSGSSDAERRKSIGSIDLEHDLAS